VPINDDGRAKRKELGMDELPETVHKHPQALDQVKKLLEVTGFIKLVTDEVTEISEDGQ